MMEMEELLQGLPDVKVERVCWGCQTAEPAGKRFEQCPQCHQEGLVPAVFCSQKCFKKAWPRHKKWHNQEAIKRKNDIAFDTDEFKKILIMCISSLLRNIMKLMLIYSKTILTWQWNVLQKWLNAQRRAEKVALVWRGGAGLWVLIHGLVSPSGLTMNGNFGTVCLDWLEESRVAVKVDGISASKQIKPKNLLEIPFSEKNVALISTLREEDQLKYVRVSRELKLAHVLVEWM
ncbi:unknown protein [Seminavis robusta]|uniref:C6H2-type domain-containing protein n=1 Tax=Seminavis robusta TaxID=568900 RepID=A0A9N8ESA9_9STRA|nr:unknown protein [Seminavis robusta]|eukprot:Sro1802_g298521.1  (233) ;mRNA; r:3513-4211